MASGTLRNSEPGFLGYHNRHPESPLSNDEKHTGVLYLNHTIPSAGYPALCNVVDWKLVYSPNRASLSESLRRFQSVFADEYLPGRIAIKTDRRVTDKPLTIQVECIARAEVLDRSLAGKVARFAPALATFLYSVHPVARRRSFAGHE